MFARLSQRLLAVLLAFAGLGGVSLPAAAAAASPAALPDPPGAVLDWIEGELAADGGHLTTSYQGDPDVESFDDWGLTIDAILALAAGGRGDGASATTATARVEANVSAYVTGGFDPDERYAGALAKTLLMAQIQGQDPSDFGGFDLADELLARLQTTGADAGRFSDLTGFGDFSNGFGQALAVMALARTADGAPTSAVDFLLAQQCPGGSFRGDYTTPGGCTDDASATVDATGFALQALVTVEPTCAVRQSVNDAVASLVAGQNASGAFGGESGSNTNSTGLAAVALRALGSTAAAEAAAGFVTSLQLEAGDDVGAVALNQTAFTAAGDGVQVLERDGFRRAATQGVLALGLPSYGEIGASAVDPAAYATCVDPVEPSGSVSAPSVVAGGQLTVSGVGFAPGELVDATLHSAPVAVGTTTADGDGAVVLTFTVPSDLEPGMHRVELVGRTSGVVVSVPFEVLAVGEVPGTLPVTGRTTGAQAATGFGLVALGGALVAVGRRRQDAQR
jgi:LPXTG-motif cell wall-anchored protein